MVGALTTAEPWTPLAMIWWCLVPLSMVGSHFYSVGSMDCMSTFRIPITSLKIIFLLELSPKVLKSVSSGIKNLKEQGQTPSGRLKVASRIENGSFEVYQRNEF